MWSEGNRWMKENRKKRQRLRKSRLPLHRLVHSRNGVLPANFAGSALSGRQRTSLMLLISCPKGGDQKEAWGQLAPLANDRE